MTGSGGPNRWAQVGSLLVALFVGGYFTLRYAGLWSEQDTHVFVQIAERMRLAGRLAFEGSYPHGFGYPVWLLGVAEITGVPLGPLVQKYLPIVSALFLGAIGFAAYRAFTGSARVGALGVLVLLLVPEVVFTVSRGNHEKLTVALTLAAMFALFRSYRELETRRRWPAFLGWVTTYYLVAFVLVAQNAFFGSSFILASTAALGFVALLRLVARSTAARLAPVARRLVVVTAASWGFVALVLFYVYPTAGDTLRIMGTAAERVSALVLSLTPEANPYVVTVTDWVDPVVYHVISSSRWILLFGSLAMWAVWTRRALKGDTGLPLHVLFMTAMYAAFAMQVAFAMVVDLTGLAAGTNLQVRLFTYFAVVAAPVFAMGIDTVLGHGRLASSRGVWRRWVLPVGFAVFGVLSLTKATLDPAVASRWLFYRTPEIAAMRFWDERNQFELLWVGVEPRLRHAYTMHFPLGSTNDNAFSVQARDPSVASALDAELVRANAIAWGIPESGIQLEHRLYDNGEATLHRRVARTPFQN